MCLILEKNSKKLVAESDIICYKFIEKHNDERDYITPYKRIKVKIGNTYISDLIVEGNSVIEVGIHSFIKYNDCIKEAKYWVRSYRKEIVVECIIPKGSEYYVGEFENKISYASSVIIYKRIIKIM